MRIASARAAARKRAWAEGMDPGFYVTDIDGTLVDSHSEKAEAAPNYKHGFGFAINQAWLTVVCMAGDLLAWTKGLCLDDDLECAEPKRLRYTLLHTAGIVVRSARRTTLRLAEGLPWADQFVAAFVRLPSWQIVVT